MAALKILGIGLLIYASLVAVVWLLQEKIAFPAPRRPLPEPATMGIEDAEIVETTTADGVKLRGWYLRPATSPAQSSPTESSPALIWFYGNFETVGVMAPVIELLRPPGFGVLILDIRGYGESEGEPSEEGFYADADAAWAFLSNRPEIDSTRIAVYGRSLGTALATYLASTKPVATVILEAPFTSGPDLAGSFYWWVPRFVVRIEMNTLARIAQIDAPLLVLHGSEDEIVPIEMGRRVAEAGNAKSFEVFEGAGHNEMLMGDPDRYRTHWFEFLQSTTRPES